MKKALLAVLMIVCNSVCWGQSMSIQKTASNWNIPTVESSFKHCLSTNEKQNCWILIPGSVKTIIANAGKVVAVNSSCTGYVYNDGRANNWTSHPEWGCVQAAWYDDDGNLYGLEHYVSAGEGYALSKWTGSAWSDLSCCFQSARMVHGVMIAYDINGTLWSSTNYGATVKSQPWCAPAGPAAISPTGQNASGDATFYVACTGGKIWHFDGTNWKQLPGSASQIASGPSGSQLYIVASNGNVQHYNGTSWDDIVTNIPASSLTVGGTFNIWMVGPNSNGSNIYRTWEVGALLSHNYQVSASCAPNVPPSACNSFSHHYSHSIGFAANNGPIQVAQWYGNGTGNQVAQVFARPQDMFTCLVTGNPNDCSQFENTGDTQCSSGANNQDNAPSLSLQWEIAYTKLEATGAPSCGFTIDLVYTCTYPVTPGCDNTATPNYNPSLINATSSTPTLTENLLSFDSSSFCWDINHTGWHCLSGATGVADTGYTTFTYSNQCTDTAP